MELTILGKWSMYTPPPTEKWFLDYAVRTPRAAGTHLTAGWHAYRAVADRPVRSAIEYFGGIGAQTLMIQELFELDRHVVLDNSPEAVRHIRDNTEVMAQQADSYDSGNYRQADLVGLDFGDLTVWKTREGQPHRDLLDRTFLMTHPEAVVLTDIAGPHLHLHRDRYESLLGAGSCATYPSYLEALADRLEALYGYVMVGGFYHRWSTVMALAPDGPRGSFVPTPEIPVGLKVIQ